MTKKELLDRCARDGAERVLLARVLDKLELAQDRGIPAHTPFLSPGEQASVTDLLNAWGQPRHIFWGGFPGAERALCAFLPDWQDENDLLLDPEGPLAALEAACPPGSEVSHRDISAGKAAVNHRECLKGDKLVDVGDILTCRGLGKCVVREIPGQSKKGRTMLVLERYI